MSKSNYLETAVLNSVLRGVAWPVSGGDVYIALHTANPAEDGSGTEVSGGSYARVAVSQDSGEWDAPANNAGAQETANTNAVTFPNPTGNWGTVTHFGIWDSATSGDLLYYGALANPRTIQTGDQQPTFAAGALTVSES